MSKHSLLLVDGDTRSMRVLEVSLRKAGFTVTTATSVQDALDKLELNTPDLIISETTFPDGDGDGFELPRRVRGMPERADIPFIFLTAEASIQNKIKGLELGVDDYLTKPIYIKEIITRINILLQKRQRSRFEDRRDGHTRFAGRVADMPVVDVIQTIEISRKSGVIQFVGDRGRQATIYFRDGRVIDAEAGSLQGEDAIYRLLTWSDGEFEVVFRTVRRREVITTSSQAMLMEGMRRLDEWSRLLEQLPPLSHRFEVDAAELATRLGDVPDDHNRLLRLIDGKRTLLEVIDASDVGDLECLQAIARLYFEELLVDLDHGKSERRDTGKPMPLVEVESSAPVVSPIEAAASGPIALPREALDAGGQSEPERQETDVLSAPGADEPGALLGGYRPSSLRLIDEAVAAAQAIEPSLFDDEPAPAASTASSAYPSTSSAAAASSSSAAAASPSSSGAPSSPATAAASLSSSPAAAPPSAPAEPAFAREDATVTAAAPATNGVAVARTATPITALEESDIEEETSIPQEIPPEPASYPIRPRGRSGTAPPPLPDRRPATRDDTGLRMIGSLGRDRAEASGELGPSRSSQPAATDTQRELVTILPRRITREFEKLPADTVVTSSGPPKPPPGRAKAASGSPPAPRPTSTPTEPPVFPRAKSVEEPAATPSPGMFEGSGVYRQRGPGAGPIALFVLAALLAGVAVFAALRKSSDTKRAGAPPIHDASAVARTDDDAAAAEPTDAGVAPDDAQVATAAVDARPRARDAAVTAVDAGDDRAAQAKEFMARANNALQEGNFPTALEYADASLKLRRTARTYLLRAQALQRLDKVDDALAALDAAAELSPRYAPIFDWRGRILWAANRKDEAKFAFQQFLEIEPASARARAVRELLGETRPQPPAPTPEAPTPGPAAPTPEPPAPTPAPEAPAPAAPPTETP